jgi:hypothetical protein
MSKRKYSEVEMIGALRQMEAGRSARRAAEDRRVAEGVQLGETAQQSGIPDTGRVRATHFARLRAKRSAERSL